ncbi:MAG: O-antigen ligase family protein [Candidatus Scalinduaceae bacterium]
MGIIFWICTISVACIITGVTFYKPYLGIAFVIVSIPFEGNIIFDGISIYPLEAVLSILVFICIFKLIVGTENYFRNTKLIYYYLPFMLCILLSALKFMEFSLTAKEIVRWLELIVVYFLTINLVNDDKKVRVILYFMILTTAMVSICGTVSYLSGVESVYDTRPGAYSFFGHPNALAGYVNLIIPILFGILMTSVFLWERITLGVFTVLSIMTWFLAFSRSAWLSLILTMILIFFLTKVKKRVVILLAMLFAIFAITFLSSNIKEDFIRRLGLQEVEDRAMFYPIGFNMVKDDLTFGIGIGNYPLLIEKFTKTGLVIKTNLHSLYLQVFVETGLMGLCAFVFWLASIIKYLMSALKSSEESRDYGLFFGLVGGVIVYLFNNFANVLTVHGIHLQWGIILGLAVVLTQFRESKTCPKAV